MSVSDINLFAKTNFRGEGKIFGIKKEDKKALHVYHWEDMDEDVKTLWRI